MLHSINLALFCLRSLQLRRPQAVPRVRLVQMPGRRQGCRRRGGESANLDCVALSGDGAPSSKIDRASPFFLRDVNKAGRPIDIAGTLFNQRAPAHSTLSRASLSRPFHLACRTNVPSAQISGKRKLGRTFF